MEWCTIQCKRAGEFDLLKYVKYCVLKLSIAKQSVNSPFPSHATKLPDQRRRELESIKWHIIRSKIPEVNLKDYVVDGNTNYRIAMKRCQIDYTGKINLTLFNGQIECKTTWTSREWLHNYCVCWKMRQTTLTPQQYEYSWSFCNAKLPLPCILGEKVRYRRN